MRTFTLTCLVAFATACNPAFPSITLDDTGTDCNDCSGDADTDTDSDTDADADSDTDTDTAVVDTGDTAEDTAVDTGTDETIGLINLRFNVTYVGQQDWLCYGYVPNGTAVIDTNAVISASIGSLTWDTSDVYAWSPSDGTVNDGCSAVISMVGDIPAEGDIVLTISWPYSMETELTYQQVPNADQLGDWWEPSVVMTGSSTTATIHYDYSEYYPE